MKDINIKEFIYKILHNISFHPFCPYSNDPHHNIKHMLWECPSVIDLWSYIQNHLGIQISFEKLIKGDQDHISNDILSILCYFIYKKFLSERLQNDFENIFNFIFRELNLRIIIYKYTKCSETLIQGLQDIVNGIQNKDVTVTV